MSIVKGGILKIAGLSGLGIVSVSGAALMSHAYRSKGETTDDSVLGSEISLPNLDENRGFSYPAGSEVGTYACFGNLFSEGVKVNRKDGTDHNPSNTPPVVSISSSPENGESSSGVLGCSLASLSYAPESDVSSTKFIFETELAFRNDEYGWAIWSEGKYSKKNKDEGLNMTSYTPENNIVYKLVLLKKEGDNWKVKGGYSWHDNTFYKNSKDNENFIDKFHFVFPENQDWARDMKNNSSGTKKYLGIWTQDTLSNQGLLQGVSIWSGNVEKPEILGRKGEEVNFSSDADTYGYSRALGNYAVEGDGGFVKYLKDKPDLSSSELMSGYYKFDIKDTLDSWYAPFRGKKGNWKRLDEYCKSSSSAGDLKKLCPGSN